VLRLFHKSEYNMKIPDNKKKVKISISIDNDVNIRIGEMCYNMLVDIL